MKPSISINPDSPEITRELFREMSEAGFGAVDFGLHPFYAYSHICNRIPSDFFDRSIEELEAYFTPHKQAAAEYGLEIGQTHAIFPTRVRGAGEHNDYLIGIIEKNIALTAFLGCRYIVVHPYIEVSRGPAESKQFEHDENIALYTALIPTAKKYGVTICLENMFAGDGRKVVAATCFTADEAAAYVDELNEIAGEERFAYCLDTGHATLCGLNTYDMIRTLGHRIKTLHMHDNQGIHDDHLQPYTGVAYWDWTLQALREVGYRGNINFETSAYAGVCGKLVPKKLRPVMLRYIADVGHYFIEEVKGESYES